jgi:hypothetical protein
MSDQRDWARFARLTVRFAELTDQADELGLDWQRLLIDTDDHLTAAIHVLGQWISYRRAGRRHWMDPLGWRPG